MSIPYIPLYVADYEADTAHLTLEEDGAYLRLLRLCWRTPGCSIPSDPQWIMRRMRVSADDYYRVVKPILDEYFTLGMGRYFNARLQAESQRIQDTHKKRSEAGKKGGRPAKALKNNETTESRAKAKQKQPEPEPEPDITSANALDGEAVDMRSIVWERGVPFLCKNGTAEKQARSLIGKWLKDNSPADVFSAFAEAKQSGTGDPVPYITEILKPKESQSDYTRRLFMEAGE